MNTVEARKLRIGRFATNDVEENSGLSIPKLAVCDFSTIGLVGWSGILGAGSSQLVEKDSYDLMLFKVHVSRT